MFEVFHNKIQEERTNAGYGASPSVVILPVPLHQLWDLGQLPHLSVPQFPQLKMASAGSPPAPPTPGLCVGYRANVHRALGLVPAQ